MQIRTTQERLGWGTSLNECQTTNRDVGFKKRRRKEPLALLVPQGAVPPFSLAKNPQSHQTRRLLHLPHPRCLVFLVLLLAATAATAAAGACAATAADSTAAAVRLLLPLLLGKSVIRLAHLVNQHPATI
jgi:hypothetical protein